MDAIKNVSTPSLGVLKSTPPYFSHSLIINSSSFFKPVTLFSVLFVSLTQ